VDGVNKQENTGDNAERAEGQPGVDIEGGLKRSRDFQQLANQGSAGGGGRDTL
jgi:hypothetical protein